MYNEVIFKCGEYEGSYISDEYDSLNDLLVKCDPVSRGDVDVIGTDMLVAMYLRVGGDIAKQCPLDVEWILFYEWLDECLCDCNLDEMPMLILRRED